MARARAPKVSPSANQEQPATGGSYVRNADGTLNRREFTRQLGDAEHTPEPEAPQPPSEATPEEN